MGIGSKQREQDELVDSRKQITRAKRKTGVNAGYISDQSDAKVSRPVYSLMRKMAKTVDTCAYPERMFNEPANRVIMIQLNKVEDSRSTGSV